MTMPALAAAMDAELGRQADRDDTRPRLLPAQPKHPPAPSGPCEHERLLAIAAKSPRRVQAAAAAVTKALARLDAAVTADQDRRREEAKAQEAQAQLVDKAARLERELAETRALLRGRRTTRPPTGERPTGLTAAERRSIRAWASGRGVSCAAQGAIPSRVVEQWRAAGSPA